MIANGKLTDEQRSYLRGLPLYPWALWSRRGFIGVFAFIFTAAVRSLGGESALVAFLLALPLALIDSVATRLILNQMTQVLAVQGFMQRTHLSTAINAVILRDALLGTPTSR
ncbi:hypothetical protein GA0070624_3531 [Micromonospora rhizosphaerae]|uniref:Uncharacterized protein n=1 Tax=Micromonospora rhizosphaerae TaxID=568872 RepID=A0A1C6SDW4_9ACTN|nr:hypothetical protein [Micromonospora rhizosphaerae]SCL27583.1 hypothetical protein GA0070624_3531 [Micromonospora rhizosphaerae]